MFSDGAPFPPREKVGIQKKKVQTCAKVVYNTLPLICHKKSQKIPRHICPQLQKNGGKIFHLPNGLKEAPFSNL
jgi:hypothetical protein